MIEKLINLWFKTSYKCIKCGMVSHDWMNFQVGEKLCLNCYNNGVKK